MSSFNTSPSRQDLPILSPPSLWPSNPPSPTSSAKLRPSKLKRPHSHHARQKSFQQQQQQQQPQPRKSTTPTPSIASTTSSFSSAKHIFSSWLGNLRAGVSGAWTKARGDTDSFLAGGQEGESRMQRRRKEIALLTEERKVVKPVGGVGNGDVEELSGLGGLSGGKRPGTSEG